VLPGKKHADFGVLSLLLELLDFARKVVKHVFAFMRKLRQRLEIFHILCQLGIQLNVLVQAAARLQDRLGLLLIAPELRLGCFFFELENLRAFACGIKDTL
jgi:hypothetical protein